MPCSAELVCVDPERIYEVWPHAWHLIKSAIEKTNLSRFEDIALQVLEGRQLLWLAWDGQKIEAAATTQLLPDVCVLTACGGNDRQHWLPLLEQIEKYAADEGCKRMRLYGRKGWERVLDGYRADYVILEKTIGWN